MSSPAQDIAGLISSIGLGEKPSNSELQWHVGYAREPATPRNCITVYNTGGAGADTDELDLFRPTIQVRTRSVSHEEGYAKQVAIMKMLHSISGVTILGNLYLSITLETEITDIGVSDNDLFLITANYQIIRQST